MLLPVVVPCCIAQLLLLSCSLWGATSRILEVSNVLPYAICLYLLALRDELLNLGEVEFKEQVELVANRAAKIKFSRGLWRVKIARLDLEELLGP